MFAFLPLLFFLSFSLIVREHFKTGRRASLLLSACFTGVLITFMTEILSLFNDFSVYPIISIWSAISIFSLIFTYPSLKMVQLGIGWQRFSRDEQFLFVFITFTIIITGLTAVFSAPNNWDAMAYHLSRVEHWIQNKTIAYYPTNNTRQLYYCPWAEYTIAHLRLLRGPESSVNMVQWIAMLGSIFGVSLIAKQLGASRQGQLWACLLAVTLPMGLLQSVSTQTDYVETFWLVCFVFFLIEIKKDFKVLYVIAAGLSLGLAFLTKGYSYILVIPFLIWLILSIFKTGHIKRLWAVVIIVLLALALNTGYYQRNMHAFSSTAGLKDFFVNKETMFNASFDFEVLVGNFLRNLSVHLGTPFDQVNHLLERMLIGILGFPHIDINDSRAIYRNIPFSIRPMSQDEDASGNLLHFVFFGIVLLFCCLRPKLCRGVRVYILVIFCAAVLFCWSIRFDQCISRYHLPLFILFCSLCGVVIERIWPRTILLGMIFFAASLPWLFFNQQHPWFGPSSIWKQAQLDQYFHHRPAIEQPYQMAAQQVQALGCRQVGVILKEDSWEYPLWVLLKKSQPAYSWRIEHVQVNNESAGFPYPLGNFDACAVLTIDDMPMAMDNGPLYIVLSNRNYKRIWSYRGQKDGFQTAVYEK